VSGLIIGLVSVSLPSPLGVRGGDGEPFGGANIAANILSPILGVGYYCVALQIGRRRPRSFSDFFGGFNKFVPVFLTALVSGLLIVLGLSPTDSARNLPGGLLYVCPAVCD
jgi:hypothetical protein